MGRTVNSQITDAVSQAAAISIGQAPSFSMGLTCIAMADTIGLVMQNAMVTQRGMQQITNAAVVQTLTLIISLGGAKNG